MSEATFASLEPALLARKGGAKPAMRPQLAPLPEKPVDDQLEDLGWNDMGEESQASGEAVTNVVSLGRTKGAPRPLHTAANEDASTQEEHLGAFPAADEDALIRRKPSAARKDARQKSARRAAFTLRLDTERHLKLRLAATIRATSAQALVTEALDTLFSQIDELDLLVSRIRPH
ncbi:MAG: hypothetical protein WA936_00545 [Erythrobacter sp.]|uniref:hypothetical protein n=1 Tax=Erythrobacter sp. TaxID=1042 RepID=UPI003C765FEA